MYQDYVQYYIMVNDNNNNNHHHHHHHDHHVDIHPFIIFMLFYIYNYYMYIIYIYICIMYIYTLYYSKILHPVQIFITPNDLPERCWMSTFPIGGWFLCWSNYFQKSLFGVSYSLLFGFVLWWSHFLGMSWISSSHMVGFWGSYLSYFTHTSMIFHVFLCISMHFLLTSLVSRKQKGTWCRCRRILVCPEGSNMEPRSRGWS